MTKKLRPFFVAVTLLFSIATTYNLLLFAYVKTTEVNKYLHAKYIIKNLSGIPTHERIDGLNNFYWEDYLLFCTPILFISALIWSILRFLKKKKITLKPFNQNAIQNKFLSYDFMFFALTNLFYFISFRGLYIILKISTLSMSEIAEKSFAELFFFGF